MTMETLPPLVVHGPLIWKGILLALVALTLLATVIVSKLSLRRRAKHELARLGEPVALETAPAGAPVTLTGTLKVSGELTKRFEDGKPAAATTAAPPRPSEVVGAMAITRCAEGLGLDVGGQDVGIQGDLEVLVGSRELVLGRKFKRAGRKINAALYAADSETLTALGAHRAVFRSLRPGDRVRVRGFLRRLNAPGGASGGYRAPGDRWVLAAQPEVGSVEVMERTVAAAYEGSPRVPVYTLGSLAKRAAFVAVLWLAALGISGSIYGRVEWDQDSEPLGATHLQCLTDPLSPPVQLSFAFPFFYEEKLRRLAGEVGMSCRWSRERVRQLAGLYHLRGQCGQEALTLVTHGEHELGEAVALDCHEPEELNAVLRVLFSVGRFAEASDRFVELAPRRDPGSIVDWIFAARIHIMAGQRGRAAAALRSYIDEIRGYVLLVSDRQSPDLAFRLQNRDVHCILDRLEADGGDQPARERLARTVAEHPGSQVCEALLADTEGGLQKVWRRNQGVARGLRRPVRLILAERSPSQVPVDSSAAGPLYDEPASLILSRSSYGGLERSALERLAAEGDSLPPGARLLRAELRSSACDFELDLGRLDEARSHAQAALSELEALAQLDPPGVAYRLPALIELARARLATVEIEAGRFDRARELISGLREDAGAQAEAGTAAGGLRRQLEAYLAFVERGETDDLLGVLYTSERTPFSQRTVTWYWRAAGSGSASEVAIAYVDIYAFFRRNIRPVWVARITSDREALARQARWSDRGDGQMRTIPDVLAIQAYDLRVARGLGDEQWAAEVEPRFERLLQAHLGRDNAVLLDALEHL